MNKKYSTGPEVCRRYRITDMTLWRWLKDEALGFPKPVRIYRRRHFDDDELDAFDAAKRDRKAAS